MTSSFRNKLLDYASSSYGTQPEYPWARFPGYAVLRHADNRKWYGLIADVPRSKLGLDGDERVDILNVKIADEGLHRLLLQQEGYLPGYHMNKESWVSILLDGAVPFDEVCEWLDLSFDTTASNKKSDRIPGSRGVSVFAQRLRHITPD